MTAYPENMRALSIAGAWGWLIAAGYKRHEYRTWSTSYRGPVLLHVSSSNEWDNSFQDFGVSKEECPKSSIVGMATVTDCFFDEEAGCYAHQMDNPVLFSEPILNVKGARNYWNPKGPEQEEIFAKAWELYELGNQPCGKGSNFLGKKQSASQVFALQDTPYEALMYAAGCHTIVLELKPSKYRGKVLLTTCSYSDEERAEAYAKIAAQGESPEDLLWENAMVGWADLVDVKLYTPESFQLDQDKHGCDCSLEELKAAAGQDQIYGYVLENSEVADIQLDIVGPDKPSFWPAADVGELQTFQNCLELVYSK